MQIKSTLASAILLTAPAAVIASPAPQFGDLSAAIDALAAAALGAVPEARAAANKGYADLGAAASAFSAAGLGSLPSNNPTTTAVYNTAPPAPSVFATPIKAAPSPLGGANAHAYSGAAFLSNNLAKSTKPNLAQQVTNGLSQWGTIGLAALNQFLNGPMQGGWPWGSRTASNTNYYDEPSVPNTGVIRNYDFTVSYQTIAPDGVPVPGITINGQFPGPLIEANWGDWIMVRVTNNLTNEGTSLHWHGFLQKGTPFYDGVPSVTQCPIAPGTTFTYMFRADLYGTTWYHSHFSAQYAGGAFGPIVVHGPKNVPYDIDLGPVTLGDWYHSAYYPLVAGDLSKEFHLSLSNNNLINGKMNYPCPANSTFQCTPNAGISKFTFQSGKKHRIRLINTSAEAVQKFSIDGHILTVMANDFVPIQPYNTSVITLGVGQRTDVIVTAIGQPTDSYWMRANISTACSANDGVSPHAVAAIYYQNANTSAVPTSFSTVDPATESICQNDDLSLTVPFYPITPTAPTVTQELNIVLTVNSTGNIIWEINNSTFRGDYNDPTLLEAKLGETDFPAERNVYNFGGNSSIRLVVYNYFMFGPHPMHLHGHNYYVLAQGQGIWDGTVTNPSNPQRRDTQLVPPAAGPSTPSYIVLQFEADNPGVWPFHCHIAWHVSGGLYANILERPADITEAAMPMVMAQTCRDWATWSHNDFVDQIDSGL